MNIKVQLQREYQPDIKSIESLLMARFGGNSYYAVANSVRTEVSYQPVKKPLTEDILRDHLQGKITLGTYQLSPDNMVSWLGWDIDSQDRVTAKRFAEKLVQRLGDIPHVVEFSGSKGYHVLLFLSEPMRTASLLAGTPGEGEPGATRRRAPHGA